MRQGKDEKGWVFTESTRRVYIRIQNPPPKCVEGNEKRFGQTWME
jgi:hypothetical protein